ncbi:MAG TPA: DUF4412 domain-containing protein [Balneolales bacterium]|nr:DUF4412 domain-containing protein [Balneolales bacterium]
MSAFYKCTYRLFKQTLLSTILFSLFFSIQTVYGQKNFEGIITFQIESQSNNAQKMMYYVKGNKVRMEMEMPGTAAGMSPTIIYDNESNKMYTLISQMKSYMEIPINLSEQEADSSNQIDDNDKPVKTGKTEKIAGVECEQWLIKTDDGETELWNAKGFGNFLFVQNNAFMKRNRHQPEWLKDIMKEGFFPFRIISKDQDGNMDMKMEVTDVKAENLSASLFEIPSGYNKMNIPGRE